MTEKKDKKKKKKLRELRTVFSDSGHAIHHHTYEGEGERQNVAVSSNPEEAGQHLSDQMTQALQQGGGDDGQDMAGAEPAAGGEGMEA